LKIFFLSGLAWGLGYAGMWSGKWVVASVLTGRNVLQEALFSVMPRSGASLKEGTPVRFFDTILRNVGEWG